MIGKINHLPHAYVPCNNVGNDESLKKITLKNLITGSVINVKNIDVDFRVLSKEFSLLREVKMNPKLITISDITAHNSQSDRFCSLGLAVSVISNLFKDGKAKEKADIICDKNPRSEAVTITSDTAINKRGQDYIQHFGDTETPLDTTCYALGLRIGSDVRNTLLDPNMINQFDKIWKIRLEVTA
ncbi:hypothetical protein ACQYRI_10600 [Salmonella enterica]